MRFLVDENLPLRFADLLRTAGHDASHVIDRGLQSAPDTEIILLARSEGSVIVTYDADFPTMLFASGDPSPSIVLFRDQRRRPEQLAQLLLDNVERIEDSLIAGAIAVFDAARVRVRELPSDH